MIKPERSVEEKWQTKFLNAGTEKGLGDLSMMIGVVSEILQAERKRCDEMVEAERKRHLAEMRNALKGFTELNTIGDTLTIKDKVFTLTHPNNSTK